MGNYFEDSYLKRVNRYGKSLQERIVNKKEYDFHHFVVRSPDKVKVEMKDTYFYGVLQTKTYNEIETIDYLLNYKTNPIKTGSVLKIYSVKNDGNYNYWIVVAKDNFVSAGYDRYTVVKLDRELHWITEDGLVYRAPVHISGSGANARDKRLIDKVKGVEGTEIHQPSQNLSITMQDNKAIQRGVYVTIKDRVWEITGYDNLTNEGVSYVTLELDYTKQDDIGPERWENIYEHLNEDDDYLAETHKLDGWSFETNLREELIDNNYKIILQNGHNYPLICTAKYFDKETESPLIVSLPEENEVASYENGELTALSVGTTELTIILQDSPDITFTYQIEVQESETETFAVDGPAIVKYGFAAKFTSDIQFELLTKQPEIQAKSCVWDSEISKYKMEVIFTKIQKDLSLEFKEKEGNSTYIKQIQVESPWIGRNS